MTLPTLLPDTSLTGVVQGAVTVAQLSPRGYARYILRMSIAGPSGSAFAVYVGAINPSCRLSNTTRGDSNTANLTRPIRIPPGVLTYFVWSGYTVAASSTVTVGMSRE